MYRSPTQEKEEGREASIMATAASRNRKKERKKEREAKEREHQNQIVAPSWLELIAGSFGDDTEGFGSFSLGASRWLNEMDTRRTAADASALSPMNIDRITPSGWIIPSSPLKYFPLASFCVLFVCLQRNSSPRHHRRRFHRFGFLFFFSFFQIWPLVVATCACRRPVEQLFNTPPLLRHRLINTATGELSSHAAASAISCQRHFTHLTRSMAAVNSSQSTAQCLGCSVSSTRPETVEEKWRKS